MNDVRDPVHVLCDSSIVYFRPEELGSLYVDSETTDREGRMMDEELGKRGLHSVLLFNLLIFHMYFHMCGLRVLLELKQPPILPTQASMSTTCAASASLESNSHPVSPRRQACLHVRPCEVSVRVRTLPREGLRRARPP